MFLLKLKGLPSERYNGRKTWLKEDGFWEEWIKQKSSKKFSVSVCAAYIKGYTCHAT